MRIVAFGCSYTYGYGLSDCIALDKINPGDKPSKLAFPHLLSEKLNYKCINVGKPGNSNKEIWYDILNFNFQPNDIAVITWTYYSRFCIIKSDKIRRINPWIDDEKLFYMNYSNRNDMILDFYGRLNHINLYLKDTSIKNYNFIIESLDTTVPHWNVSPILGTFEMLDKAEDNCHPGTLSHAKFSDELYKIIHPQINI